MKKILFIFCTVIAFVSCTNSPKVDEAYMTLLESHVAMTEKQLPIEIITGQLSYFHVELDKSTAILTHCYCFNRTPTITEETIREAKANVISLLKLNSTERMPIEKGITLQYKYYSRNRNLLYTITVTEDDLY